MAERRFCLVVVSAGSNSCRGSREYEMMSGLWGIVLSHSLQADGFLSAEKRRSGSVVWPPFISVNLLKNDSFSHLSQSSFLLKQN